jgi:hypothetical protein
MNFINDIARYLFIVYAFVVVAFIFTAVFLFIVKKIKSRNYGVYKYKGNKLKLVRNNLGVKRATFWLLHKDFKKIIEDENKALDKEYIKPFDFTKIRELKISSTDIQLSLVLIAEKKEILPEIFNHFIERKDVKYDLDSIAFDFEKDYWKLSTIANQVLNDFFFENWRKLTL